MAGRLRVPGLIVVLGLAMAIGSDGLGLIHFGGTTEDVDLARTIGVIALVFILFEGGLASGWGEIRPVLRISVMLAIFATIAQAVIVGLTAGWLLDLSTEEGLLLGSIVAATDSAAIFSVLRGSSLKKRLARILEGESGMNDPVAIVLVLGFIEFIQDPAYTVGDMALLAVTELGLGVLIGLGVGRLAVLTFQSARISAPGLYPVASLAFAALGFGIADVLHASGFIAVYLVGLALGSGSIPGKRTIDEFHDGLAWISQIAMFMTLGLLVNPSEFGGVIGESLLVAAVLMFVARPLAVYLFTLGSGLNLRESTLVGWAGLRGAVPIVLATFPVIDGVDEGGMFFNIVFFVVLASTLVQGVTLDPLAKALGVTGDEPALPRPLHEVGTIRRLGAEVLEYPVRDDDAIPGLRVNQLELPREALVSVIVRDDEALLPRGSTEVAAGDRLHILVRGAVRGGRRAAVRPLAVGTDRPARRGAQRALGPVAHLHREAVDGGDGRPGRTREGRGRGRHPRAAHAPRPPRGAGAARRRPAGRDRKRRGGRRRSAPAVALLPRAGAAQPDGRGARLVAGGHRRGQPVGRVSSRAVHPLSL